MIVRKIPSVVCVLVLTLQLAWPVVTCAKNCHLRIHSCHRLPVTETSSPKCPHEKTRCSLAMVVKLRCECAIQAYPNAVSETAFSLDPSRTETARLSIADFEPSSKLSSGLFEARFHSPPLSPALAGQNTFLINSSLRI